MSLVEIKQKAARLSPAEQGELMAFLGSMQIAEADKLRAELTRKIDDKDSANWIGLDELKQRWGNEDWPTRV